MKYLVIEPLKLGGKRIEPGAVVDLSNKAAGPLLQSGAIEVDPKIAATRDAAAQADLQRVADSAAPAQQPPSDKG